MKTKIKKEKPISYKAAIEKIKKLEADLESNERKARNAVTSVIQARVRLIRLEDAYARKISTLAIVLGYNENTRGRTMMSISTSQDDEYNYVLSRLREVRGEDQGQAFYAMKDELEYLRSLVASRFEVDRKNPLLPKKCTGIDCDFCKGIDC